MKIINAIKSFKQRHKHIFYIVCIFLIIYAVIVGFYCHRDMVTHQQAQQSNQQQNASTPQQHTPKIKLFNYEDDCISEASDITRLAKTHTTARTQHYFSSESEVVHGNDNPSLQRLTRLIHAFKRQHHGKETIVDGFSRAIDSNTSGSGNSNENHNSHYHSKVYPIGNGRYALHDTINYDDGNFDSGHPSGHLHTLRHFTIYFTKRGVNAPKVSHIAF